MNKLPTFSSPWSVSDRLDRRQLEQDWARTSQAIFRSPSTPGSFQTYLLFTMVSEQASGSIEPMQTFISLLGYDVCSTEGAFFQKRRNGGAERDRTADPLLAKQVLSQLSYSPIKVSRKRWWAWIDSNYRPHPYQGCALAT